MNTYLILYLHFRCYHQLMLIKIETLLVKKWYKVVKCGKNNSIFTSKFF
jgi:hypothetical protein